MDLREAQWGYVTRSGSRHLYVQLDDERIAVLFGSLGAEVWYFLELEKEITSMEPAPRPDAAALASALTELSSEDLSRLEAFCAEPRTMDEIEESLPDGGQAWFLRKLGVLRDTGKKGRKIVSVWAGYNLDTLMESVAEMIRDGEKG